MKTLWFADDQLTVADSEDALQISMHKLSTVTNKQVLNISAAIPLEAWTGPEGSRRQRLPDFKKIGTRR